MRFPTKSLLLVLAFSVALASSALAVGFSVGVTGGMNKFTGDAGEGLKTGMVFGAHGDYMINDMWAAGANLAYSMNKHEEDGEDAATLYPGLTGEISSELKILQFGAHAKFFPPMTGSPIAPYLVAGLGMYNWKSEFSTTGYSEDVSETDFGFRGGVGANYSVNPVFGINAEADFHSIMTEDESTNLFTVRAGVVFKLPSQ